MIYAANVEPVEEVLDVIDGIFVPSPDYVRKLWQQNAWYILGKLLHLVLAVHVPVEDALGA